MFRKIIFITIFVLLLIGAIVGVFLFGKFTYQDEETKFRKSLKGEIVFTRRDGLYLNIYKINANGTGEKMLYHHNIDEPNLNSFLPEWSDDGLNIYFTAMKNKEWKKFEIDINGNNIQFLKQGTKFKLGLTNQDTREKDIIMDLGSISYLNEKGEKNLVLSHKNFDPDLNPGPEEVSWSPDKKYIIFELDGYITIINKEGSKMVKIVEGMEPDWKY
ncbi:MAG: hypothetical protein Athens101410_589 [Parcubacteria group bacterium Athens1014_10]|nr:MAG: hypothetical protein Athens101410_589 [Parcubacteria group bacterium Athens1014_10]TSD04650.1 MAG: hypothetical protein Athens071412_717 [Parcubacteria group bacterium Athens0714_12]